MAQRAGARRIMLTDINDWRLNLAKKVAPSVRTVNVLKQHPREVMYEMGLTEGFDVGLEMSGKQSAFDGMIDLMIMGGSVAMLGIPSKPFPVDLGAIVFKSLTLKGIYGRQMYETWYKMLAMLDSGLDISGVITDHFAAAKFQDAFDLMLTGKAGKVILDWTGV